MPDSTLPPPNPVWHSLLGPHRHLALTTGDAARYPADVAPFAALAASTPAALNDLASLLAPGESMWLVEPRLPSHRAVVLVQTLPGLRMALPANLSLPESDPRHAILPLAEPDLPDMLDLIHRTFPGFFRPGSLRMGAWFGIRDPLGKLLAMAGERFHPPGHIEISGLCADPVARGHGLAATLLAHLARRHRTLGEHSWLHVTATNPAVALYRRLGLQTIAEVTFQQIQRTHSL